MLDRTFEKHIKTSDPCCFCMENVETILYVFISCEKVIKSWWRELSLHIVRKTSERVGFNVCSIIFGQLPLSNYKQVINSIILYVQQQFFYP